MPLQQQRFLDSLQSIKILPRGVISTEKEFETLQLTPLDQIAFGGWDIQKDSLIEVVQKYGIIQESILQKIEMQLSDIPI